MGLVLAVGGMQGGRWTATVSLATLMMLLYPAAFLTLRHFVLPDQGEQLASRLSQLDAVRQQPIHLVGKPSMVSKLRVCSQGKADVHLYELWRWDDVERPNVVILSRKDAARVDTRGYEILAGSQGVKDLAVDELVGSLLSGKLTDYLQRRRQCHVIAVRKNAVPAAHMAGRRDSPAR
jgi:hypothetical protein